MKSRTTATAPKAPVSIEQPSSAVIVKERPSLTALPTSQLTLEPGLLASLQKIAPQTRPKRARYVIGGLFFGVLVALFFTPEVQERLSSRPASPEPAVAREPSPAPAELVAVPTLRRP